MLLETKKQRELLLTSLNEKRAGIARPFLYIMKLNTVPLILLLCLCSLLVTAQKETAVWYFGYGCGLDFNYNPPKVLNDGEIATKEGSSSICDSDGNLLFYTDGVTVWNRNHQLMPNGTGLMGHFDAAQSALIVKQPEKDHIFYIFTVDCCVAPYNVNGLRYSIVDMRLDNGNGDITNKNTLIHSPVSERLNAIRSDDGKSIWISSFINIDNKFISFKLNETGISQPHYNPLPTLNTHECQAMLKISPNGELIALTNIIPNIGIGQLILCSINDSIIEILTYLNLPINIFLYTTEFSPMSQQLFYPIIESNNKSVLYRVSLDNNNEQEIKNSNKLIASISGQIWGMQLAIDGNIYFIHHKRYQGNPTIDSSWVGVIYYPDDTTRTYVEEKKYIFENSNKTWIALPNFVQSYFDPFFQARLRNDTVLCNGSPIKLGFYPGARLQWSTGDTASEIVINKEGEYSVIAIHPQNPGWKMYDTVNVAYKPCSGRCNQLQVAPNPNTGAFEIQLENARKGSFQLYTSTGKQIGTWQVEEAHGLPLQLNLNLSPGMYLLRYITAECNEIVKFIVLRE